MARERKTDRHTDGRTDGWMEKGEKIGSWRERGIEVEEEGGERKGGEG